MCWKITEYKLLDIDLEEWWVWILAIHPLGKVSVTAAWVHAADEEVTCVSGVNASAYTGKLQKKGGGGGISWFSIC